jgi:crotonobetainyl-CoA:carnitine CoA-transferase CaiB-like acyl-CoA transferase
LFGLTARFEKTPGRLTGPPPRLSAHTNEVLAGLGLTEDGIAALRRKGVI